MKPSFSIVNFIEKAYKTLSNFLFLNLFFSVLSSCSWSISVTVVHQFQLLTSIHLYIAGSVRCNFFATKNNHCTVHREALQLLWLQISCNTSNRIKVSMLYCTYYSFICCHLAWCGIFLSRTCLARVSLSRR
jgi:hypothetical protein